MRHEVSRSAPTSPQHWFRSPTPHSVAPSEHPAHPGVKQTRASRQDVGGGAGSGAAEQHQPSIQCAGEPPPRSAATGVPRLLPRRRVLSAAPPPLVVQGVSDMLATKGVKKAAAEKALDALAEKGKVVRALEKGRVHGPPLRHQSATAAGSWRQCPLSSA